MNAYRKLRGAPDVIYEGTPDEPDIPQSARRAFVLMALTIGYALVMGPVGYLISCAVYMGAGMYLLGIRSRLALVMVSVVLSIATYLLFAVVLRILLPSGVLTELLRAIGMVR